MILEPIFIYIALAVLIAFISLLMLIKIGMVFLKFFVSNVIFTGLLTGAIYYLYPPSHSYVVELFLGIFLIFITLRLIKKVVPGKKKN